MRKELKRLGWTKAKLKRRGKGDASKVTLAQRLREETTVSVRWIAESLHMKLGRMYPIGFTTAPANQSQYLALILFFRFGRLNPVGECIRNSLQAN